MPELDDVEIKKTTDFLKENIHKDYYLINCLKHGVGYHYGKMPNQIRNLVEKLFKEKRIKYLFCTSTLLEGVNLPAQCIFLYKPQQGPHGISPLNFRNLAGRAGRLLKDYYGNIFCINPDEWDTFPNLDDVEHEIESILEKVVESKDKEILDFLRKLYRELKGEDRSVEQAITKFIIQEMKRRDGSIIEKLKARFPNVSPENLETISEEVAKIAGQIEIPPDVIQKNSSISPLKQQELLELFRSAQPTLPKAPWAKNSYDTLKDIIQFIDEFFLDNKSRSYLYFTMLIWGWIKGESTAQIIASRIQYAKKTTEPTPKMVNKEINNLFADINNRVRFEYQKYIKCYVDILAHHYESKGYDEVSMCMQWPTYMEYGSHDERVIMLQAIGLSRGSALALQQLTPLSFEDETDCMEWLKKNLHVFRQKLSPVMYDEISQTI